MPKPTPTYRGTPLRPLTKAEMERAQTEALDLAQVLRLVLPADVYAAIPGETPYPELCAAGRQVMALTYGTPASEKN